MDVIHALHMEGEIHLMFEKGLLWSLLGPKPNLGMFVVGGNVRLSSAPVLVCLCLWCVKMHPYSIDTLCVR